MNKLPQMASIADMRNDHLKVFSMLSNGPVLIANRSKPFGVVLSPEMWDQIVEQLDQQYDEIQVLQAKLDRATGKVKSKIRSQAEIDAWATDEQTILA